MKTEFDLHTESLTGYYGMTHNKGYHGPGHLNICAMQMYGDTGLPDENIFRHKKYYSARSPLGIDILRHETKDFVIQNMKIGDQTFSEYLNDGIIWLVGQEITEFTLWRLDETDKHVFLNNEQMRDAFGSDAPDEIRYAYDSGLKFRGWEVSRRFVEVDAEWRVIKEVKQ